MDPDHPICFETWLNIPSLKCLMQRFYESATFSFADSASVHTYLVNPAYQSATFWTRSSEWKFLNTLWIRNRVDAKYGFFLSGDVTRSSAVLYRERQSKMQISRALRRILLPIFTEESWVLVWIRIRVDVEIYESETKSCGFKNIQMRVDGT